MQKGTEIVPEINGYFPYGTWVKKLDIVSEVGTTITLIHKDIMQYKFSIFINNNIKNLNNLKINDYNHIVVNRLHSSLIVQWFRILDCQSIDRSSILRERLK